MLIVCFIRKDKVLKFRLFNFTSGANFGIISAIINNGSRTVEIVAKFPNFSDLLLIILCLFVLGCRLNE